MTPTIDFDIDDNGHQWTDAELCCLECRNAGRARYGIAGQWWAGLSCECGEFFAVWPV